MTFPEISTMHENATAMHEMFITYISAGFTEDQALKLIAYMLASITVLKGVGNS